jgi:hypothetical protein
MNSQAKLRLFGFLTSRRKLQMARESPGELDYYRIRASELLRLVRIGQPD